ncbi:hypothetical protein GQR58_018255 [Nymphon striatum]|nr:hypothetical protein GQR58_018255 [Nymphon striatum]
MAANLPIPPQIVVGKDTETQWKEFKESYKNYSIATELNKKDKLIQACTLKTLIGPDARRVLLNLTVPEGDLDDPVNIVHALDEQFLQKTNVIFERFKFHNANQTANETVDQFVDRIRQLAKSCCFHTVTEEEMIRDRIVLGSKDEASRARLFRQKDLTSLSDTINLLKISEATTEHMKEMNIDSVNANYTNQTSRRQQQCSKCGRSHDRMKCPAYGKKCLKCGKLNHFAARCNGQVKNYKKNSYKMKGNELNRISERTETDVSDGSDDNEEYLYTMHDVSNQCNVINDKIVRKITVPIKMLWQGKSIKIKCQIDTGATCNVISEQDLKLIQGNKLKFQHNSSSIKLYNNECMKCLGEVEVYCQVNKKLIKENVPKRLQRMMLRLQKYELTLKHIPGKDMHIADFLSRACLGHETHDTEIMDLHHINQIEFVNVSAPTKLNLQRATRSDIELSILIDVIMNGWPDEKFKLPPTVIPYFTFRDELNVQDGIVYKGQRVIVPKELQSEMIKKIHSSHQGVEASIRRASDSLFWIGMAAQIKDAVNRCDACNAFLTKNPKEPLMTWGVPTARWQMVAQDIFTYMSKQYLITVDYFSDYWEVDEIPDMTSETVISCTKEHFARHGIPFLVITDNGRQFVSAEFEDFSKMWNFEHRTSSPYYPQSNGKAEITVKIVKNVLKKAIHSGNDFRLAILNWRNTPDEHGNSPVQKLFSRRTRTVVPTSPLLLDPVIIRKVTNELIKDRQAAKAKFDRSAKELPGLVTGEMVRLQPDRKNLTWRKARVTDEVAPRSYLVETEEGDKYRRNRKFLKKTSEEFVDKRGERVLKEQVDNWRPEEVVETAVRAEGINERSPQMRTSAKEIKSDDRYMRPRRDIKMPKRVPMCPGLPYGFTIQYGKVLPCYRTVSDLPYSKNGFTIQYGEVLPCYRAVSDLLYRNSFHTSQFFEEIDSIQILGPGKPNRLRTGFTGSIKVGGGTTSNLRSDKKKIDAFELWCYRRFIIRLIEKVQMSESNHEDHDECFLVEGRNPDTAFCIVCILNIIQNDQELLIKKRLMLTHMIHILTCNSRHILDIFISFPELPPKIINILFDNMVVNGSDDGIITSTIEVTIKILLLLKSEAFTSFAFSSIVKLISNSDDANNHKGFLNLMGQLVHSVPDLLPDIHQDLDGISEILLHRLHFGDEVVKTTVMYIFVQLFLFNRSSAFTRILQDLMELIIEIISYSENQDLLKNSLGLIRQLTADEMCLPILCDAMFGDGKDQSLSLCSVYKKLLLMNQHTTIQVSAVQCIAASITHGNEISDDIAAKVIASDISVVIKKEDVPPVRSEIFDKVFPADSFLELNSICLKMLEDIYNNSENFMFANEELESSCISKVLSTISTSARLFMSCSNHVPIEESIFKEKEENSEDEHSEFQPIPIKEKILIFLLDATDKIIIPSVKNLAYSKNIILAIHNEFFDLLTLIYELNDKHSKEFSVYCLKSGLFTAMWNTRMVQTCNKEAKLFIKTTNHYMKEFLLDVLPPDHIFEYKSIIEDGCSYLPEQWSDALGTLCTLSDGEQAFNLQFMEMWLSNLNCTEVCDGNDGKIKFFLEELSNNQNCLSTFLDIITGKESEITNEAIQFIDSILADSRKNALECFKPTHITFDNNDGMYNQHIEPGAPKFLEDALDVFDCLIHLSAFVQSQSDVNDELHESDIKLVFQIAGMILQDSKLIKLLNHIIEYSNQFSTLILEVTVRILEELLLFNPGMIKRKEFQFLSLSKLLNLICYNEIHLDKVIIELVTAVFSSLLSQAKSEAHMSAFENELLEENDVTFRLFNFLSNKIIEFLESDQYNFSMLIVIKDIYEKMKKEKEDCLHFQISEDLKLISQLILESIYKKSLNEAMQTFFQDVINDWE